MRHRAAAAATAAAARATVPVAHGTVLAAEAQRA